MKSFGLALLLVALPALANVAGGNGDRANVTLAHHGEEYTLANGNMAATILEPEGSVVSLKYHGTNLVASSGKHDQIYWSMDGGKSYQNPAGMKCTVKSDTPEMADVGCKETYNGTQPHAFDIEIHYCLRRGMTGLYVYAILSHPASYPATSVGEWRIVWQTPDSGGKWLLEKIYVDKTRHWVYPTKDEADHALATPIKEITIMRSGPWQNRGESKYTYAANYEDIGTFGFASDIHKLGAWTVMGAFEYYNDGPRKQDLTALEGGMTHHFGRNHFGDTGIAVAAGEQWSKIFGPFLLYANSGQEGDALWHDAQAQSAAEQAAWPYAWLTGVPEYPSEAERGSATGTFAISDAFKPAASVKGAWIGADAASGGCGLSVGNEELPVLVARGGGWVVYDPARAARELYAVRVCGWRGRAVLAGRRDSCGRTGNRAGQGRLDDRAAGRRAPGVGDRHAGPGHARIPARRRLLPAVPLQNLCDRDAEPAGLYRRQKRGGEGLELHAVRVHQARAAGGAVALAGQV